MLEQTDASAVETASPAQDNMGYLYRPVAGDATIGPLTRFNEARRRVRLLAKEFSRAELERVLPTRPGYGRCYRWRFGRWVAKRDAPEALPSDLEKWW